MTEPRVTEDPLAGLPAPVADFLAHKSGRSPNTLATYRNVLVGYLGWKKSDEIDERSYDRYILHLRTIGRRQNGIALVATVLRDYAKRAKLDTEDWQIPKSQAVAVGHLRKDEIAAMRNACMNGSRAEEHLFVFDFLVGSGVRVGEFLALRWSDLDLAGDKTWSVREAKENKTRTGLLTRDALGAAVRYLNHRYDARVTPAESRQLSDNLSPIRTRSAIDKMLSSVADRAGLAARGVHAHMLRHTFAVLWLEKGLDVRRLQLHLGHSSLETTAHYLQLVAGEEMKRLPDMSLSR